MKRILNCLILAKFLLVFLVLFSNQTLVQAQDYDSSLKPLSEQEVRNKLKGAKIISIQDYDKINLVDQFGHKPTNEPVNDYDRNFPKRLKQYLGIEIVIVRSDELIKEMKRVKEKDAEKIANVWINDATEVKTVTKKDIVRNARLYLSLKEFLRKYEGDAITMTTSYLAGYLNPEGSKTNVWFPLSILELSKEHIPASCQSHLDCLATMMIGTYLTGGYMGFDGDVLNDWSFEPTGVRPEDVIVIGHCGAPVNPHGDDRIPYLIRDHIHHGAEWAKLNDEENIPTATTQKWPVNETVTVVKFDVYRKKVSIFTGKALDGPDLYKDFENVLCRNKLVVKLDDPESSYLLPSDPEGGAFRNWFGSWGCHQVVFYGNIKRQIKEFAELTGFEVVE